MMGRGPGAAGRAAAIAAIAACALAIRVLAQQPSAPQPPVQQPAPQQAAAQPAAVQPATPPDLKGDLHRGKELSYTCLGCHGIDGYRNAYPDYSVPKLEGQNPEYLSAALHGYRDGDRSHITMHSQAEMLSDQDIADIASYFAGKPLTSGGRAPGPLPKAVTLCTSCHGQDGVTVAPMYPSLAGQHEDYLVRAIEEYRNGGRKNAVMKGFAASLKPEDIEVIARYFSSLTPALHTEPRPYTRFSAQ